MALFAAVLLFILVPPYLPSSYWGGIIITILLSIMTIQSVYILVEKEKNLKYGFAIGFAVLVIIWVTHFLETPNADNEISNILLFLYFSYILFILITHLIKSKEVNLNMIIMAITIYLLMAIEGGFIFAVLNQLYDNAFNISGDVTFTLIDYIYYSFITLTTLGYGDVLPMIEETRIPAALLATLGQIYMAVIVAVLVGKYISKRDD